MPQMTRPRPALHRLSIALLLTALGLATAPATGAIYKWTDANGEVHYTQTRPPADTESEQIDGAPPPPDPAAVSREQQHLDERIKAMEERQSTGKEAASLEKERENVAKIDEKNCITAKNNLEKLQQGGVKRYLTPEGEVIRLTDNNRAERINEAQTQIDLYCHP